MLRLQVLAEEPADRVEKVIQKLVKAGVITPPLGHSEVDPVSEEERRETMVQSLRQARLTSPLANTLLQQAAPISPARRAELEQALATGKPLSEIVIEERAERW